MGNMREYVCIKWEEYYLLNFFRAMLDNMGLVESIVGKMRKRKHNQVVENINGT